MQKNMFKKIAIIIAIIIVAVIIAITNSPKNYQYQLFSVVTDAGEVINKIVITYPKNIFPIEISTNTYTVNAKSYIQAGEKKDELSYDINRNIVKTETTNNKVILYLLESEGSTLTWLDDKSRNYPGKLEYTITQNTPIKTSKNKVIENGTYIWDNKVINDELAKFESVIQEDSINYQFYNAGESDKLIVWFHGNGEGDFDNLKDNSAQIRANKGGVAWVSDKAQEIFGKAHVLAFQVPDTWYYAERDNLLEIVYNEINDIVNKYNIDKNKIMAAGCSAGGYMTTRMIIKYPDLFASSIVICPAFDVATDRGGRTPTTEELSGLRKSKTAIWLVQGETDGTVETKECAQRMFNILTQGENIVTTRFEQELNSDFTTYETLDNKYKLSIYDTVDKKMIADSLGKERYSGKLEFAEDYDQDGVDTLVQYIDHFSWIYPLNNNTKSSNGTQIMNWASSYINK